MRQRATRCKANHYDLPYILCMAGSHCSAAAPSCCTGLPDPTYKIKEKLPPVNPGSRKRLEIRQNWIPERDLLSMGRSVLLDVAADDILTHLLPPSAEKASEAHDVRTFFS